ncbi:MAG TPA: site-specific DNA-methyltransferase [Acetobacteraceae bacterium]|nr:site-specific DNA-methyltransferase [Acetobacteraceae bacterium]
MAKKPIAVETLTHTTAKRRNIPTAEMQSLVAAEDAAPRQVRYPRETPLAQGERRARDPDLDPQLVWRGKDQQDWSDLVVQAPPLYVQEKIHPKAIIADLLRQSRRVRGEAAGEQLSFFDDFSGLPDHEARLEFYAHNQNWSNRFILGDSLHVMASLAEKEGLRGQVQCIYFDPPYGIRFNSNWQVSTRSRDVKDGKIDQISREPEQVKAFRDTWKDGINSYLTYLRDRLTVARDLLHESGSIFVQIGDENVHRVRAVLDEVFGADNLVAQITSTKTGGQTAEYISGIADYVLWYSRNITRLKFRRLYYDKSLGGQGAAKYRSAMRTDGSIRSLGDKLELCSDERAFRKDTLTSQRPPGSFPVRFQGRVITPSPNYWKTHPEGMHRLVSAGRILPEGATGMAYVRFLDDFTGVELTNVWTDIGGIQSRSDPKVYVVQTASKLIERCLLMATDPGDLVLDPTCGSGTTATVAEQWGRRWITIDTSRVALALARARVMGARYPYYLLADSPEGQRKEAEITRTAPREAPTHNDIRQGFVCERVPHITLKSIANNA